VIGRGVVRLSLPRDDDHRRQDGYADRGDAKMQSKIAHPRQLFRSHVGE
jgi:hypothetical protein